MPEVLACRERLSLILAQDNYQSGNDTTDYSPKTNCTTLPVSFMAASQPDNMDAEYSDTYDDLVGFRRFNKSQLWVFVETLLQLTMGPILH